MNVFVLSTGRCGSTTFREACKQVTNFSSGHESRAMHWGETRFNYPDQHIEVDNRLSWCLGRLDAAFGAEAFYVHLIRDKEGTVNSLNGRWHRTASIMHFYTQAVLMTDPQALSDTERWQVCTDYYETVNENIRHFLQNKPLRLTIHMESWQQSFPDFWQQIGAEGDLAAALQTLKQVHNEQVSPGRYYRWQQAWKKWQT